MKLHLLFLLLLCLYFSSNAQEQDHPFYNHELNFSLNYNHNYFKDLNYSPLNYRANGFGSTISYQRQKALNLPIFGLEFTGHFNRIKTPVSDIFTANDYGGNFQLYYLFPILENSNTRLYLGPKYHFHLQIIDFRDFFSYSFFTRQNFAPKVLIQSRVSANALIEMSISAPLFSLIVRPPYNAIDESSEAQIDNNILAFLLKGKFATWNNFQDFEFNFRYQYSFSEHWEIFGMYQFNFTNLSGKNRYIQAINSFSLGTSYKF